MFKYYNHEVWVLGRGVYISTFDNNHKQHHCIYVSYYTRGIDEIVRDRLKGLYSTAVV